MADALIETGIGVTRALVIEGGAVVEAWLEPLDTPLAGDVADGRLASILVAGRRGIVLIGGEEALLEPVPAGLSEGATIRVEMVREAVPESGRPRLAKVRATASPLRRGPDLAARLAARGLVVRHVAARDGVLDTAGWHEATEIAVSGLLAFSGGLLTISPTPAMTVIDVDGPGPAAELALASVAAVARTVRLLDLGGSIGVDLPTVADRALRSRLGEALDAALPPPFERTAVNGFGFVQIVRPRLRPSLIERSRGDPVAWAALDLLRAAERSSGAGTCNVTAAPAITAWLENRPALREELSRRLGAPVALHAAPALPISGGHVHRDAP